MPDRAGDPAAIEIERGEVGAADIGGRIHLHPVDHRVEIARAAARYALDRLNECAGDRLARRARVERVDLAPPFGERRLLLGERSAVSSAMSSTSRQNA